MALAIDASSPAVVTGSGTVQSASFTPPDGSLLKISIAANSVQNFNPVAPTITDNLGVHLAYTLSDWYSEVDNVSVSGQTAIWTAPIGVGAPMRVSVTVDPSNPDVVMQVMVMTGQDPVTPLGAHGKGSSTSTSAIAQTYTGQATSGQGFIVVCDWDALGNPTAGSGCSITAGTVGGQISWGFARRTVADDSLGSTNTLNVTLPGASTNASWCYLEILPLHVDENLIDPPPYVAYYPPGFGAPNGRLTPWLGNQDAPAQPVVLRVTATETGVTNNGMSLAVKMVTGQAVVQNGQKNSTTTITTPNLAITPNATGSWVYGALINANSTTTWTPNGSTTFAINTADVPNGAVYGNYRSTATTTAATPVTLGASAPTGAASGGLAQAEILSATGLVEDAASPATVTTTSATVVNTNIFTAVPGSLLVATVCADSGAGVVGIVVSGGGLTWTELIKANASSAGYAGVWIAQVPGTPAAPAGTAETGTSTAAATAYATAVHIGKLAGNASATAATTAVAVKVATQTGRCCAAASTRATATKVQPLAATATSAASTTATAKKVKTQTGTAPAAATTYGSAKKVAPGAGTAAAAATSYGAVTHAGAGTPETGTASAGASTRATAVHVAQQTGRCTAGAAARSVAARGAPQAGRASAGATAAATTVKRAVETGTSAGGATARATVTKRSTGTGTASAVASCTGLSRKLARQAATSTAAAAARATASGRRGAAGTASAVAITYGTVQPQLPAHIGFDQGTLRTTGVDSTATARTAGGDRGTGSSTDNRATSSSAE